MNQLNRWALYLFSFFIGAAIQLFCVIDFFGLTNVFNIAPELRLILASLALINVALGVYAHRQIQRNEILIE